MKNNLCLFESPFKVQKKGVFLFEISFFVLEISTFFYYANLVNDDVMLFATKMWKILNKRYLWKYWSSVLETWHHKCTSQKKKMTPLVLLPWQQFGHWCCVNKNCNSQFCFKTRTIYPNQSNDGTKDNMGTISVPSRTLCPTVEVANGDFLLFDRKRLGPKELLWKQH